MSRRVWAAVLAMASLVSDTVLAADPRLVTRVYQGDEVVRIEGKAGVQATIAFGEGEQIENVAVGDADKWQITPNKRADLLFVKPLAETARTNMTVVTDHHTYFFDLVATPAAKPVYMLRFSYAEPPAAQAVAVAAPRPAVSHVVAGSAGAAPSALDPALLNFAWKRHGALHLLPASVYDDGSSTYLLWNAGRTVPSILLRDPSGAETPAALTTRGNTVVLATVPKLIVLRDGRAKATLANQRDDAAAPVPVALPAPPQQ